MTEVKELKNKRNQLENEYLKSRTRIYNTALNITGNKAEAEDIVQRTFEQAYGNIGTFREEASYKTWLMRIAINFSLKYLRTKNRDISYSEKDYPTEAQDTPETILARKEDIEILRAGLSELSTNCRTILKLELRELDRKDIKSYLGLRHMGAVRARIHRARKNLRKVLEDRVTETLI